MGETNVADTPLDAVADVAGTQATEAFELLANDTRIAILLALWDALDPTGIPSESDDTPVTFSELRERVGMRDSGQFNYHLEKLVGRFVEHTEDGYTLTTPGEQVLRAVFAGTLTDRASFEGEPMNTNCFRCGSASVVIDYSDGILVVRCTGCEGAFHQPDQPTGMLAKLYRPPVGLTNRTPQEFLLKGNAWDRHRLMSMVEGACPDCSGTVSATSHICETHDTSDGSVCKACGSLFEVQSAYICDVCKYAWGTPVWTPIFSDLTVLAFFDDHDVNPNALLDEFAWDILDEMIAGVEVTARDPPRFVVTIDIDGDRLEVTLDDQATVREVTDVTD